MYLGILFDFRLSNSTKEQLLHGLWDNIVKENKLFNLEDDAICRLKELIFIFQLLYIL